MRHEDGVFAVSFDADGQRIFTAARNGIARVWDAQSGEPVGKPIRHEHTNAASFSPNGRRISPHLTTTLRRYGTYRRQAGGEPMRHDRVVTTASFSPDGRRVVTASTDKTARVWDAESQFQLGRAVGRHCIWWDCAAVGRKKRQTDGRANAA